ncbi:IPT/TIG domain-containing protein [Streptomyces sp. UNOC14_S4]|uniref:IPT/TIG domain-containing protein n=1 Tax=Streptomyces sp. UNOC14_S4 TaxID=2872340 RepID=UPI001E48F31D|nr:IPT/TIG domain-containing protein [Streptomyces sp. UNOC14_S4]MCC3771304.1 IPT/TIG domain-containing protein [Streptomyces sp. UNOC14_S4]
MLATIALVTPSSAALADPAPGADVSVGLAGNYPARANDSGNFSVTWTSEGSEDVTGVTRLTVDLPPGLTTSGALMYSTPYDYTFTETVSPDGRHLEAVYTGTIVPGRSHFMKVQVRSGAQTPSGTITATVANAGDADPADNVASYTYGGSSEPPAVPGEPVVTGVDTTTGPGTGGTTVRITGYGLDSGLVLFGDDPARTSCTSTACTAVAPGGTGSVPLDVLTPGGAVEAGHFAYTGPGPVPPPAPAVTRLSTQSGPAAGGTSVNVFGTYLAHGTVRFGGRPAAHTSCGPEFCGAVAPAGTGTVDVTVETGGGTSPAAAPARYTYTTSAGISG